MIFIPGTAIPRKSVRGRCGAELCEDVPMETRLELSDEAGAGDFISVPPYAAPGD